MPETARKMLHDLLRHTDPAYLSTAFGPGAGLEDVADAILGAARLEAAERQWATARQRWTPQPGDGTKSRGNQDRKFGAAERMVQLLDPNPAAWIPRHIRTLPVPGGIAVHWQQGEDGHSQQFRTKAEADVLLDELHERARRIRYSTRAGLRADASTLTGRQ